MLSRTMRRECSVQWSFPSFCFTKVHVGAAFDQKLAQPPVAVKSRGIEAHVLSQRLERLAVFQQELESGNVAVVCAPLHQRAAVARLRTWRISFLHIIEHKLGTSLCDSL